MKITKPASGDVRAEGRLGRALRGMLGADAKQATRAVEAPPVAPAEPPVPPPWRVLESHDVGVPQARVRILATDEGEREYEVVEPALSPSERGLYAFLRDAFLRSLDVDLATLDAAGARSYLRAAFDELVAAHRGSTDPASRERVRYHVERDFLRFGPIDVIMHDPEIEDISCDGAGVPVYVFHRRHGSVRTNVSFATHDVLDAFVMQLIQRSGKHISVADPLIDATLPDGSRLQASFSKEITTRGSTFTIRKLREDPLTPPDLVSLGTLSPEMAAYFWLAVEHGASLLICGGTASGKTTTLNALSLFIPPGRKVVSIEDTREINLPHENWIPSVTRAGGASGTGGDGKRAGEVDMFDLLKASLRQRPEYILFGEIRGREALVLFQAMATGHSVASTMHADSVESAVHRLESKPLEVPRMMVSALDIVCIQGQVREQGRRARRVREIVEITGIDPQTGEVLTNRLFRWDPARGGFSRMGSSAVLARIAEEIGVDERALDAEFARRLEILTLLQEKGIRDIASVGRILATYAVSPERALAELRGADADG